MTLHETATTHRWVTPIDQIHLEDAASVGGKAANLGELTRARFPVPPGFAVAAHAYLDAMAAAGIREELRARRVPEPGTDDATLTRSARELRSLVRGVSIPEPICTEIVGAYRDLGDAVPVAVRSSAPAEDAADTSFAGIHESFTDVVGEDALLQAVRECWASLWSERALTYRSVQGYDDEPSVAVVV